MTSVRRLLSDLVARIDRIADQDADPAALTGRAGRRRHGLPVVLDGPAAERLPERTPEEALQALEELRADQHQRMRGGRRSQPGD